MDLANLVIKVDSSEADKAAAGLDKLGAASKRTNVTVEQAERYMRKASIVLGDMAKAERTASVEADRLAKSTKGAGAAAAADIQRLKAQLDPTWAAQQRFNQSQELGIRALKAGAIDRQQFIQHMRQINAELKGVQRPMDQVTTAAGAHRAGMQQLGFQFQDFAVQVAGGTSATRAFAQQMPQAIGAVQLMAGSTSKLGAFMGGPWGIALGVAAAAIGPLIASLMGASAATDELREAEAKLASSIGTLVASRELLDDALGRNSQNYAELRLRALAAGAADLEAAAKAVAAAQIRVKAAQAEQAARDDMLQSPEVAAAGGFFNPFGFGSDDKIISSAAKLKEKAAALNEASASLNKLTADLVRAQKASGQFDRNVGNVTASTRAATRAVKAHAPAINEAQKAYDQAYEAADAYIKQLTDEIARIGKTEKELRLMADARAVAAAATDAQRVAIQRLSDQREMALGVQTLAAETAKKEADDAAKAADAAAAATSRWLEQVDALIGSLGNMRGLGGILGDLGGILTSKNPIASMLGMGGIGTIAGSLLNGSATTEKLSLAFYDGLKRAGMQDDNLAAKIGGTLANVFQGAAIGGSVGGILGGGKAGSIGGQLGGAAGQAIGSSIAALGSFGGPIGAIAGAIIGNVLGSALQSTKRGGATIGAGGVSGTWGNSQSRIGAATDMGGSAVNALQQLASALGVPLGTFSSSVSVRKNDLRFDPTGSGISKTSKGALSFGQDEEALLKAVIKDAISDGAFAGLSEGFKNYLTSGDVEARLQDVLNLKGVMNEAAQMRDPQGFALGELDKWRTSMLAIATATGEGMADIEFVYGKKREEILAAANDNIVDLTRDRTALLIQIAEMEGRSTEALAMARDLERSAADESLRPLYDRIYALQDVAQAEAETAQATAAAEQAERELADARKQASQIARSFYEKQRGLEINILQLQGKETDALRLQRELELFAMDASLRPLLMRKYALEDEAAAAAAAATEAARLAAEQEALAEAQRRAAEEAAARQKAITDEIGGLNRQWLETIGDTQALRDLDLAALLSDEARGIQQRIWDYNDALAAQAEAEKAAQQAVEDYTRRLEDARNALSAAYERESSALQGTIDKFRDFASSIRDFRLGLLAANDNTSASARSRFLEASRGGDAGLFASAGNDFLAAALNTSRSRTEYQNEVGFVMRTALEAERAAFGQAGMAQMQLDKMTEQVSQFIDLNDNVVTVEQAIRELQAIEAESLPVIAGTMTVGLDNVASKIEAAAAKAENAEQMSRTALEAILKAAQGTERQLARIRIEGGAVTVRTDSDTPIITEAA